MSTNNTVFITFPLENYNMMLTFVVWIFGLIFPVGSTVAGW